MKYVACLLLVCILSSNALSQLSPAETQARLDKLNKSATQPSESLTAEVARLRKENAELKQQLHALSNVIDELRKKPAVTVATPPQTQPGAPDAIKWRVGFKGMKFPQNRVAPDAKLLKDALEDLKIGMTEDETDQIVARASTGVSYPPNSKIPVRDRTSVMLFKKVESETASGKTVFWGTITNSVYAGDGDKQDRIVTLFFENGKITQIGR